MKKEVLVTGGVGLIGSQLCDLLRDNGYTVKVLGNPDAQVIGKDRSVELNTGDIRDREVVEKVVRNVNIVFHFAAKGGVGQSRNDSRSDR